MLIKQLRKANNMTIDVLASKSGLSRGFISQLETGKRKYSEETLRSLAEVFGVELSDMFEGGKEAYDEAMSDLSSVVPDLTDHEKKLVADFARLLIQRRGDQSQT